VFTPAGWFHPAEAIRMATAAAAMAVANGGNAAAGTKSYRRRKARTVFSDQQLQGLEQCFG
jgi:hypothetical protein